MAKTVRFLKQIVPHLEKRYGKDKTAQIMEKAMKRYAEIIEENRDEPKRYHMHTRERIYPAIAVFDALLMEEVDRKEAAEVLVEYYRWRSEKLVPFIRGSFRIPGLYKAVPKIFSKVVSMSFSSDVGFSSRDSYVSDREFRLNMVGCPYLTKCVKYGCPEIVRGFCDADDICYGNMHPKLSWDRTKTLGRGDDVCDFGIRVLD